MISSRAIILWFVVRALVGHATQIGAEPTPFNNKNLLSTSFPIVPPVRRKEKGHRFIQTSNASTLHTRNHANPLSDDVDGHRSTELRDSHNQTIGLSDNQGTEFGIENQLQQFQEFESNTDSVHSTLSEFSEPDTTSSYQQDDLASDEMSSFVNETEVTQEEEADGRVRRVTNVFMRMVQSRFDKQTSPTSITGGQSKSETLEKELQESREREQRLQRKLRNLRRELVRVQKSHNRRRKSHVKRKVAVQEDRVVHRSSYFSGKIAWPREMTSKLRSLWRWKPLCEQTNNTITNQSRIESSHKPDIIVNNVPLIGSAMFVSKSEEETGLRGREWLLQSKHRDLLQMMKLKEAQNKEHLARAEELSDLRAALETERSRCETLEKSLHSRYLLLLSLQRSFDEVNANHDSTLMSLNEALARETELSDLLLFRTRQLQSTSRQERKRADRYFGQLQNATRQLHLLTQQHQQFATAKVDAVLLGEDADKVKGGPLSHLLSWLQRLWS